MRKIIAILFLLLLSFCDKVYSFDLNKCKESFQKDFPNTFRNAEIDLSSVPGLCEIKTGLNVLYYIPPEDKEKTGYLLVGEIYKPSGKNLTVESREKLVSKVVSTLDLRNAIRIGNGPVKAIMITDPDCPFCIRLEKFFTNYPGIAAKLTRYVFLYPLTRIHPESDIHARWILCQNKASRAYELFMNGDRKEIKSLIKEDINCERAEKHLNAAREIANKLGVRGTPFLIVGNTVISGFNPGRIVTVINRLEREIPGTIKKHH